MKLYRCVMSAMALCLLAACSPSTPDKENGAKQADAAVEVVPGSISDAMIPMDRLQSESPRENPATTDGTSDSGSDTTLEGEVSLDEGG